jgi:hypothetical protein
MQPKMLPLLFLFTLIKADPYHREYWLTPKTPSFSVLVLPRENVNWTLCLVYNSNTDGFDQAFPGQAPSYCSTGKERYYGFVVLKGLYLNNLLNVTVYRATIDVEVLLVNNLDSGGNALVFYFVRSVSLHGYLKTYN